MASEITARRSIVCLAQWSECCPELLREELRLLPRCKVTAFREPVVVSQFRIGLLCPALWRRINLVGKNTYGRGNLDTLRSEEGKLAFPIEASRRDRRVRQIGRAHV